MGEVKPCKNTGKKAEVLNEVKHVKIQKQIKNSLSLYERSRILHAQQQETQKGKPPVWRREGLIQ